MANLGNKDKQHTYNSTPKSCAIKQLTITLNLAVVNTLKAQVSERCHFNLNLL